jgi:2-amino-4-hydroxy-6-hydroxymethyldihydropteridine diphosphokinase
VSDERVVIGFGGNVGTEEAITERFRRAREALAVLGDVRSAPLYRSAPIGPEQPAFLNTAVSVRISDVRPDELLATVLELERLLGRERPAARWGPRAIDLDILLLGERVIAQPDLEVPHPRLAERRFALEPLGELVGGDHVIPGRGRVAELLARVRDQTVELVSQTW